jgi:hypothetical protein
MNSPASPHFSAALYTPLSQFSLEFRIQQNLSCSASTRSRLADVLAEGSGEDKQEREEHKRGFN